MSENTIYAYFIEDQIQSVFGSKNPEFLEKVLSDKSALIEELASRFSDKGLIDAIVELINGVPQEENRQFHYSFALWIIIDGLAKDRPNQPCILAPGLDLYAINEVLVEEESYPQLLTIFQALNNEIANTFPFQLSKWGDLPGFAYVGKDNIGALSSEIKELKAEIEADEDWLLDIEEIDELETVLAWMEEAVTKKRNLLMVMDGDL